MNEFYDLNDFVAFCLRKIKMIIIIICIAILGFAAIRFKGEYEAYQNSQRQQPQERPQNNVEEPMKNWSEITLNVLPNYEMVGDNGFERGSKIAYCYAALRNDSSIMKQMEEKYFEQAKEYADKMRSLMSQYGYILDKEKNNKYMPYDFQRQFAVSVVNNYVTIGFYSLDTDFATQVVGNYEKLLTEAVEKQYPKFEYEKISENIRYELPEVSPGASPSRSTGNVGGTAMAKITMSMVITQTIKGCVWGLILGVVISLVIVFMQYMMSRKIMLWAQLQKENMKTYGLCYKKQVGCFGKMKRRCVEKLEGNSTAFDSLEKIAQIIASDVEVRFPEETILVCGSEYLTTELVELLNKKKQQFEMMESPLISENGIEHVKGKNYVILLTELGATLKDDVKKEIQTFDNYGIKVVGIVGIE